MIGIFYHKEDNDGVFSGALTKQIYSECYYDDIEMIGIDHLDRDNLENNIDSYIYNKYSVVVFVDIALHTDKMVDCYNHYGKNMIWIDHHAPIIKEVNSKVHINGLQDPNNSAIYNCWKFFLPYTNVPKLVKLLSAYDAWTYERDGYSFDYINKINTGVTSYTNLDINIADTILKNIDNSIDNQCYENPDDFIDELYKIGEVIIIEKQKRWNKLIQTNSDKNWIVNNRKAVAVFINEQSSSQIFKCLQNTEYKTGIVFKINGSDNVSVHLYNINNDDEFHQGEFCNKYRGGGHQGAAGFTMKWDDFVEIMKSKMIQ